MSDTVRVKVKATGIIRTITRANYLLSQSKYEILEEEAQAPKENPQEQEKKAAEPVVIGVTKEEQLKSEFAKIPNSEHLLGQLKSLTNDKISDFELMQYAIRASKSGIDTQKLPELIVFAAGRAENSVKSIDELLKSFDTPESTKLDADSMPEKPKRGRKKQINPEA